MLTRRYLLMNQSRDRTAIKKCLGVLCSTGLNVAECPAKQTSIELFGNGEVRGYQFDKYDFADMMLLAGRLDNRRQLERCGHDRHCTRNAEKRGKQPCLRKCPTRSGLILCVPFRFDASELI